MVSIRQKLTHIVIGCVVGLVISEIIIRKLGLAPPVINNINRLRLVDNPRLVYEFIPNIPIEGGKINQQGFKDVDFVKEKRENLVRIAMLGDSVTEGTYVPLGETFSDRLEQLLNQQAHEKGNCLRYEVMNFGIGGYNLTAEVELLRTKALSYSPDIVVLNFFPNDFEPLAGITLLFHENDISEKQKLLIYQKYFYHRNHPLFLLYSALYKSKLYLFLIDRIYNIRKGIKKVSDFLRKYEGTPIDNRGKQEMYHNLQEIEKLKQKNNFKFLVCIHPQLLCNESLPNTREFAKAAEKFNFPYFYMYDYYKQTNLVPESLQVKKRDCGHPNELGHRIIARALFNELERHDYITFSDKK